MPLKGEAKQPPQEGICLSHYLFFLSHIKTLLRGVKHETSFHLPCLPYTL